MASATKDEATKDWVREWIVKTRADIVSLRRVTDDLVARSDAEAS
jgi:hypothetical protein